MSSGLAVDFGIYALNAMRIEKGITNNNNNNNNNNNSSDDVCGAVIVTKVIAVHLMNAD